VISFRYRDKGTVIHRLNPFSKIAWVVSVFVAALVLDNPLFMLILFLSTLPFVAAAKVWREWASFMKHALYICLAIIVINALVSYNGSHVLAEAPFSLPVMGTPRITVEAIVYGVGMAIRLLAIISAFAVLTLTVNPDDLMLSMIKMKLPYKSVLVMALSTRFVPTLLGDAERISDVQRSRGLELDRGRLPGRVRRSMHVMIPLLSNSLDRTVQISEAMESRAFGSGTKRTYYRDVKVSRVDMLTVLLGLAPCALVIVMAVLGYGNYSYYPTLGGMNLGAAEWAMLPFLALLVSAPALLAFLKRRIDLD